MRYESSTSDFTIFIVIIPYLWNAPIFHVPSKNIFFLTIHLYLIFASEISDEMGFVFFFLIERNSVFINCLSVWGAEFFRYLCLSIYEPEVTFIEKRCGEGFWDLT